jgi:chromosome segregation ATPase
MAEIRRYQIGSLVEDPYGSMVVYVDHLAALASLRAEHEAEVKALQAKVAELEKHCGLFMRGLENEEADCAALNDQVEALETENAALKAKIARLTAPVGDEEISVASQNDWQTKRISEGGFGRIIAARAQEPGQEETKP